MNENADSNSDLGFSNLSFPRQISSKNQEGMFIQTLPYYTGISVGLVGAFLASWELAVRSKPATHPHPQLPHVTSS